MEFGLLHKTALVMASSQGLGFAIAEKLAKEGANVIITGRNEEKLEELQKELSYIGTGRIVHARCDITNKEDIAAAVKTAADEFGHIDLLVNNAGGPPAGTFEETSDEAWQAAFELNLLSYIRVIREVLPYMREKGGKIVNIASSSIKEPLPNLLLSNVFRLGIAGLTKTLSQEFADYNILVNTLAPGRIATDRIKYLDEAGAEKAGITIEEMEKQQLSKIPLKRYGSPEEFANYAAFLLSDANTYLTGQTLLIDGGLVKAI